ncbi:TetR family transcriptional regulator [Amycolatopsis sp. lyj-108]|uniref:TetR family transcriptional regulator n=1 Tax=Amycolatopsis sp. lyj-108 TaxID=2789286 RepID=UPI00397E8988
MRKLAAVLSTDSSSLYRHFRNKAELLRAVADRALLTAIAGYEPEGDWKQCVTDTRRRRVSVPGAGPAVRNGVPGG